MDKRKIWEQYYNDNDENNKNEIDKFFKNLHSLFCKTSDFHGIKRADWKIDGQKQ